MPSLCVGAQPDIADLLALAVGELVADYGRLPRPQTQGSLYALLLEAADRGRQLAHEADTDPAIEQPPPQGTKRR